ncbi:MAG: glycerophosphodiester phosphodiesterase family protein [Anderseniella sp.]|jgi:glycerophosphoryl diester phosphodiesterase|nr:glycerophosphodiester phosphodiesterase family protein [Anderseniella sp.]
MWRPHNPVSDWLTARPIAHRGLHEKAAGIEENSLEAFAAAITHGYAIECDLQLSADGEAMVFHDDTLDRLTTEIGPVIARTAANLQKITFAKGRGTIPTLTQLLDLADGDAGLVLELKSHWNGDTRLVARVASLLAGYDGPVAVMSFDPVPIAWMADNAPALLRGIVADGATDPEYDALPLPVRLGLREFRHADVTRPDFLSLWREWLPSPVSREARAAGLPIITWTIRDNQQASDALRWCDQITFEGYRPAHP